MANHQFSIMYIDENIIEYYEIIFAINFNKFHSVLLDLRDEDHVIGYN